MRLGGLGLRSASRMSHAAYWASWADSLQMIAQRLPTVAAKVLANLADDQEAVGCLRQLAGWTTKGLKADQGGQTSETANDLHKCRLPNLASGSTAGNTTHLPLPNTITGRAWCLLGRLPRTRLICAPTQDQAPVPSCSVALLVASSRYKRRRSGC